MSEDIWYDSGLKAEFHFNEEGQFVDNEGKRILDHPKEDGKFVNDNNFCDWLHGYVERRMAAEGLQMILAPENKGSPIWFTPNAFNSPENLLVIICGSGRIHAGVLSVGVAAYHGLDMGTDLPWIKYAKEHNMEVVVLNPNHSGASKIKEKYGTSLHCARHSLYVFEKHIIPGNPQNVFILAHSAGGISACELLNLFQEWYVQHVKFTALTDAVEDNVRDKTGLTKEYLARRMINWVRSKEPLDKVIGKTSLCQHRSANTDDHPLTTGKAMPCILANFEKFGK